MYFHRMRQEAVCAARVPGTGAMPDYRTHIDTFILGRHAPDSGSRHCIHSVDVLPMSKMMEVLAGKLEDG
jgi:hypothetical protein